MAEIRLSTHSIERFNDRVRPTLDRPAAEKELRRLVGITNDFRDDVPWAYENEDADCYLVISDGIALALTERESGEFIARTCLTRAGHSDEVRQAMNRRKRARRRKKQTEREKGYMQRDGRYQGWA